MVTVNMLRSLVTNFVRSSTKQFLYRRVQNPKGSSRNVCIFSRILQKDTQEILQNASSKHVDKRYNAEELLCNSVTGISENNMKNDWSSPAYPKCEKLPRDQSRHRDGLGVDPKLTNIVLFPGQGTQYVGMGRALAELPEAKAICDQASDVLGYDILELCLSGPSEKLNRTEFSQMAVFVLSIAAAEHLKSSQPGAIKNCVATAGFSIGEISALVFSGALSFSEAIELVKVRGEAMQELCDNVRGGMMTVFYTPESRLEYACLCATQWCAERGIENPVCRIANYLFPHCKVVAGNSEALDFIEKNSSQFALKRLKRLPVSGAFHTSLMKPAAEVFKKTLKTIQIRTPKIPVYSNVDGKKYRNQRHILQQLPQQIYKPVKWEQTLHVLYERTSGENFPCTFECGPGTSLKSCLKMVNAKAWSYCSNINV